MQKTRAESSSLYCTAMYFEASPGKACLKPVFQIHLISCLGLVWRGTLWILWQAEMEAWSLFPDAASRLTRLEDDLGAARLDGPDGRLVRGGGQAVVRFEAQKARDVEAPVSLD